MPWTRTTYYEAALEEADSIENGVAHPRFSNTARTKRLLGLVHMEEWKGILAANPFYVTRDITVDVDASGLVSLDDLSTGEDNDRRHLHRVLAAKVGDVVCWEASLRQYPFAHAEGVTEALLIVNGRSLELPSGRSTSAIVKVNDYPCRADLLDADDAEVDFPDGYEMLLAYRLAARLLAKGAEESGAAAYLDQLADGVRNLMISDLRRLTINPSVFRPSDDVAEWGA